MKNYSLRSALLGTTVALMVGITSVQAEPTITADVLPANLQLVFDRLPPPVQQQLSQAPAEDRVQALKTMEFFSTVNKTVNDPALLQAAFSPQAHSLFDKLSLEEQARAISDIQQDVRETLHSHGAQQQFAATPTSEQSALLAAIISQSAYVRADAPNNYCNVMLDKVGANAYNDDGVKKLAAIVRECPTGPKVDLKVTLEYVNKTLACAIGDPAFTRVLPPEEYSDMQEERAGTKTAFASGGIGLNISADPTMKLSPTAKQLEDFAKMAEVRQSMVDHPEADACTGLPTVLSAEQVAALKKPLNPPSNAGFGGLIFHVIKGGPADQAGIIDGDVVVKVDGEVVTGLDSNDVVEKKLRGPLGSQVTLTVKRGDTEITKTMTRAPVLPDNVWSRDLGDGIYAIVITNFARSNTAFMVYDEIMKIGDKARAYVFDVRNNPGGLLDEAIKTASWFIHDGAIVSQRERISGDPAHPDYNKITWSRIGSHVVQMVVDETTGKVEGGIMELAEIDDKTHQVLRSFTDIPFLGGKPMVVLADDHSASAAEIYTAAMTENRVMPGEVSGEKPQGATFVGTHTFGKFIGQVVMPGPLNTAVKATSFRYFSPKGEWLGDAWKVKVGLTATVKVDQPETAMMYSPSDAQLTASKDYLVGVLNGSKEKAQTP